MTANEGLATGFIVAGLAGALIWSLIRGKSTPKYQVPSYIWICEDCSRCDELYLESARYFNGQWQYWIPAPENLWASESEIDKAVARAQQCGYPVYSL